MKFEITNRYTKDVQFTADIECEENTAYSKKKGIAIIFAIRNCADLYGANLYGANLSGADLNASHGINDYIKCIQIDTYAITYTSEVMQIGCQRHSISDWQLFTEVQIRAMDGLKANKFWDKYKEWIFATIAMCPAKPTKESENV